MPIGAPHRRAELARSGRRSEFHALLDAQPDQPLEHQVARRRVGGRAGRGSQQVGDGRAGRRDVFPHAAAGVRARREDRQDAVGIQADGAVQRQRPRRDGGRRAGARRSVRHERRRAARGHRRSAWTYKGADVAPANGYISSPPAVGNGVAVVPVSGGDGYLRGRIIGVDVKTGKELWTFFAVPGTGRSRPRDLAGGQRRVALRRRRRLDDAVDRSRFRARVHRDRERRADVGRRSAAGRQPLHVERARAGPQDRQAAVALSAGSPRAVGGGSKHAVHPVRRRR